MSGQGTCERCGHPRDKHGPSCRAQWEEASSESGPAGTYVCGCDAFIERGQMSVPVFRIRINDDPVDPYWTFMHDRFRDEQEKREWHAMPNVDPGQWVQTDEASLAQMRDTLVTLLLEWQARDREGGRVLPVGERARTAMSRLGLGLTP